MVVTIKWIFDQYVQKHNKKLKKLVGGNMKSRDIYIT